MVSTLLAVHQRRTPGSFSNQSRLYYQHVCGFFCGGLKTNYCCFPTICPKKKNTAGRKEALNRICLDTASMIIYVGFGLISKILIKS